MAEQSGKEREPVLLSRRQFLATGVAWFLGLNRIGRELDDAAVAATLEAKVIKKWQSRGGGSLSVDSF